MRRSAFTFITGIFAVVLILALAFVYIDLTGHKSFSYGVIFQGENYGSVTIDRYITERRVVYKSRETFPFAEKHPLSISALYTDRGSRVPLRYLRENPGLRGQKTFQQISVRGDKADHLFIENPRYLKLENFPVGENTSVYSPEDIMLCKALMERYSYWKRGTQYFEVMILLSDLYPPLRDRVSIRFIREEYFSALGRKVEADIYSISSDGTGEVLIAVSRQGGHVLSLENEAESLKFVLERVDEGPSKLSSFTLRNIPFINTIVDRVPTTPQEKLSQEPEHREERGKKKVYVPGKSPSREVFFESGNILLNGRLRIPEGEGPFNFAMIVPGEGPITAGEMYFTEYLSGILVRRGYVSMDFDFPGQGKSQGNFHELDDRIISETITSALNYLRDHELTLPGKGVIISRGSVSGPVLKASEGGMPCVLMFPENIMVPAEEVLTLQGDYLKKISGKQWMGSFDPGFMAMASREVLRSKKEALSDPVDTSFFMGARLPVRGYRDWLERTINSAIVNAPGPVLVITERGCGFFERAIVSTLRENIVRNDSRSEVLVVNGEGHRYFGSVRPVDGKWQYVPDNSVFTPISEWLEGFFVELD